MTAPTLDTLAALIEDNAAISATIELTPSGGVAGEVVMPPTYPDGDTKPIKPVHVWYDGIHDGRRVQFVVLDEVQSQANRFEAEIERAIDEDGVCVPFIEIAIVPPLRGMTKLSSLSLPHRVADGFLRDSVLMEEDKPVVFSKSSAYCAFEAATLTNATWLFEHSPNHILFGGWHSMGADARGAKFPRCLTSRIVGIDAQPASRAAIRVAPMQMGLVKTYEVANKDLGAPDWTPDVDIAAKDAKGPKAFKVGDKARGDTSSLGLSMIPGSPAERGATCARIEQRSVLSLPSLRNLRFPDKSGITTPARDHAARNVLAAMALWSVAMHGRRGMSLRSGCDLMRSQPGPVRFDVLGGEQPLAFTLTTDEATALLRDAIVAAVDAGFSLVTPSLRLTMSAALRDAVSRSIGDTVA